MDPTRSHLVRVRAYAGPVYVATIPRSQPLRTAQSPASFEAAISALAFRLDRRARAESRPASVREIEEAAGKSAGPREAPLEERYYVLTLFPN
jgi:hypothetical protein